MQQAALLQQQSMYHPGLLAAPQVYLIADHVIKLYVEDGLEVSLHALGAEGSSQSAILGETTINLLIMLMH
ncbi:hypothetical protein ACSBR2_023075 [Camellia fascicularis]